MLRRVVALCGMFTALHSVLLQGQQAPKALARVRVVLVAADLNVKPVPLFELELVSKVDSTLRTSMRTSLDGVASAPVALGEYWLRSKKSVALADSSYSWAIPISITSRDTTIDLNNSNAEVSFTPRVAVRQVAPEREIFEKIKSGVFRVEAGLGHGSGFLIDKARGLVATNQHVVANAANASVYLDTITRIPAQIVFTDATADVAILRIATSRCTSCVEIPLAGPSDSVVVGERVFAVGFPLSQELTLTTGIVSAVRGGGIISDVNINHGNSGGPLINLAGQAIAINTFLDPDQQGGPGVSGAVAIEKLVSRLPQASAALTTMPTPDDRVLPSIPRGSYPPELLRERGQMTRFEEYKNMISANIGRFELTITTPVVYSAYRNKIETEIAADRKKREAKAGISGAEQYGGSSVLRDWEKFVGDQATPVVTFQVVPKVAETFGSALGRAFTASMIGVAGKATMKYQGDVRSVRFFRNGVEVEPVRGGHGPQELYVDNAWVQLKDVADQGYYVLTPNVFAPDSAGTPPAVSIVVEDLKHPNDFQVIDLKESIVARIWNDFVPYFKEGEPSGNWVISNAKLKAPRLTVACNSKTRECTKASF